jgi:hypothetical protein
VLKSAIDLLGGAHASLGLRRPHRPARSGELAHRIADRRTPDRKEGARVTKLAAARPPQLDRARRAEISRGEVAFVVWQFTDETAVRLDTHPIPSSMRHCPAGASLAPTAA